MTLGRLARHAVHPVTVQLTAVLLGALAVPVIAHGGMSAIQSRADSASRNTSAQLLAGSIVIKEAESRRLMLPYLAAPDAGGGSPAPLTLRVAVDEANLLRDLATAAAELHFADQSQRTEELLTAARAGAEAFNRYIESSSRLDLAELSRRLDDLRRISGEVRPVMAAAAVHDQQSVSSLAARTRLLLIVAPLLSTIAVAAATFVVGRRLSRALGRARTEQEALQHSTRVLERRNGQFQALYQIVAEVSESLSLRYVVQTAIREAKQLVGADIAVLRLLRGEWLEVAGVEADSEVDALGLGTMQLGSGLVGRAAKRGRAHLVPDHAELQMADGEKVPGAASGLVLPLIVGARVVGTLSCWSRQPAMFTADDQQVLEMMASQVATAVAAADLHATSEQDALTDALTTLPNRRSLGRDIEAVFAPDLEIGLPVTVAMIDVDHFKRFNDEFGHRTGDITLQRVAEILRTAVRESDRVYRYGGEEFTIVMTGIDGEQAVGRLDHIRAAVARTPLTGDQHQPIGPITISAGVASGPVQAREMDELIALADAALYQSKWAGRNRVTLYALESELFPGAETAPLPEAA